jgi:hypothetical protein
MHTSVDDPCRFSNLRADIDLQTIPQGHSCTWESRVNIECHANGQRVAEQEYLKASLRERDHATAPPLPLLILPIVLLLLSLLPNASPPPPAAGGLPSLPPPPVPSVPSPAAGTRSGRPIARSVKSACSCCRPSPCLGFMGHTEAPSLAGRSSPV